MSHISFSNQLAETQGQPEVTGRERRALRREHDRTVRFHLLLNLGYALAATYVLKLDGPYYADGIAAALFGFGALLALWSRRQIVTSETEGERPHSRLLSLLCIALAVFSVAACAAVVYYTYIVAPDMPMSDDEGLTQMLFLHRQFA